jgi:inorganic pyrophosphatase
MALDAVVEVAKGNRNRYEVEHETGRVRLDRSLFTSTHYPGYYGYFEQTLALDGDPLDVLILLDEPTFRGCLVSVRPVALFDMSDENDPDAKVIGVPAHDPRWDQIQDLPDLDRFLPAEIGHFFEVYKALEPGKGSMVGGWRSRAEAETEITDSLHRFRTQSTTTVA